MSDFLSGLGHQDDQNQAGSRPERGQSTADDAASPAQRAARRPATGGHPHGKKSSWALAGVVVVAFIVGGIAMILHVWWLLYTCAAVVVLSIPAGKLIGVMDDTVVWGASPSSDTTGKQSEQ